MIQFFISNDDADEACAEQVRRALEEAGHAVWRAPDAFTPQQVSYGRAREEGIRGSAGVVLLWSANAAESDWVRRDVADAVRLQKAVVPVALDGSEIPATLVEIEALPAGESCASLGEQILQRLPAQDGSAAMDEIMSLLSHAHIRERKAGITRAAQLLEQDSHVEPLLAALEDISRKDLIMNVREEARRVLEQFAAKGQPAAQPQSRHNIGVRCPNGHVSYFNKREICGSDGVGFRHVRLVNRAGSNLDEIVLKCKTCNEEMVVEVDCEGYK